MQKVRDFETKLLAVNAPLSVGSLVYAQTQQPAWIATNTADKLSIYFVGESTNDSLAIAKEEARKKAVEKARTHLADQLKKEPTASSSIIGSESLREYITKSAEVTDTYYSYDRNHKLYHYYIRLKLDRTFADPGFIKAFMAAAAPVKVLETTRIEQWSKKALTGAEFQGNVEIHVGMIDPSKKPFKMEVWELGTPPGESKPKKMNKITEVRVSPMQPRFSFDYHGQKYTFVGTNIIAREWKNNYIEFEIYREYK